MTHEKVSEFRVRGTCQYSNHSVKEGSFQRRCRDRNNGKVRSLQEASLQVYSAGAEDKAQDADPGTKGSFHHKTSREPGIFHAAPCRFYGRFIERSGHTGPENVSEKKGVWPESLMKLRCFTVMIVWAMRRSPKSTGYFFQRSNGR
jgi:hypothetical protein